jgi:hypothetical protein
VRGTLSLPLGDFGRTTVEKEAARYSLTVEELVRYAVYYYLDQRESGRQASKLPRFSRTAEPESEPSLKLSLDLDEGIWSELPAEAGRQGVSVGRLLEHAVLYLLADLDAGRVASSMLDGID